MTQELSSLMDGELDGPEAERAIRSCCGSDDLKQKWQAYHLIGEAMRGEGPCRRASTERIMAALRQEPTVLAPRRPLSTVTGRVAFAAAASVATVAVVGWIGMQDRTTSAGPVIARQVPAETPSPVARNEEIMLASDYVVVHRQIPNADFYRPASVTAVGGR